MSATRRDGRKDRKTAPPKTRASTAARTRPRQHQENARSTTRWCIHTWYFHKTRVAASLPFRLNTSRNTRKPSSLLPRAHRRPDKIAVPGRSSRSKRFSSHLLADREGNVPHEEVEPGEPLDRLRGIPRALLGPILTDGRTDGRMDERTDGRTDGRTVGKRGESWVLLRCETKGANAQKISRVVTALEVGHAWAHLRVHPCTFLCLSEILPLGLAVHSHPSMQ